MTEQAEQAPSQDTAPDLQADPQPKRSSRSVRAAPRSGGSGGQGIGWFALLLAVVSLGLSGWLYWHNVRHAQTPATDELSALADSLAAHQQANESALQALVEQRDQWQQELRQSLRGDLQGEVQNQLDAALTTQDEVAAQRAQQVTALSDSMRGIEQRLASLERSLERLDQSSDRGSDRLRIQEAQWLMHLAEEHLNLANDPGMALAALRLADAQLRQANDPRLGAVRRTLAQDLQQLEAYAVMDVAGLSGQLLALEAQVEQWPLRGELLPTESEPLADTVGDAESEGFLEGVGEVLGKLVVVRRDNRNDTPVLAPDAVRFLRENSRRELAAARHALQLRDPRSARQTLARVGEWINQYFDAASLAETLASLQSLDQAMQPAPLPQLRARAELEAMLALDDRPDSGRSDG